MKRWLKRVRGAVGLGLTWAVVWFGVGAVLDMLSGAPLNGALLANALQAAVLGFLGGACQRRLKMSQTWRVKMLHPAEVTSL